MNLYIQVKDGITLNHPVFEDNLLQVFSLIPADWEPFTRVQQPEVGPYQYLDSPVPSYKKISGVWTDVWLLRDMSATEKAAKQQAVKDIWAAQDQALNYAAWVFSEELCKFVPPVPYPPTGDYSWSGVDNNWKETIPYPSSGGPYKFDLTLWTWVPL